MKCTPKSGQIVKQKKVKLKNIKRSHKWENERDVLLAQNLKRAL